MQIEWLHNNLRVTEDDRYRFVNEGDFHCIDVAPVTAQDAGTWTCIAYNLVGEASSTCNFGILGNIQFCIFNELNECI